ncbi:MAG: hypothetical protein WC780_06180 [Lentimicrobiaceae bacterium]|jgi:hypothetical protein
MKNTASSFIASKTGKLSSPLPGIGNILLSFELIHICLLTPGKPVLLWSHPVQQTDTTSYLPDKRVQTHKQIGKPASGLSPPSPGYFSKKIATQFLSLSLKTKNKTKTK